MLEKLLTLLVYIAQAVKQWQRKREQTDYEKQVHDIEKDPAEWLDGHFNSDGNRMRNNPNLPDNAADASQADTTKLDNK